MGLRPVEFWLTCSVDKGPVLKEKFTGTFHAWGQRGGQQQMDFFGVVETSDGNCIELDPVQIKFLGE